MDLIDYGSSVFSQQGEDGVIRRIFSVVGPGERRCCEFGAWDGIHFSNARALVLDGWEGVFIESDPHRFRQLCETYADMDNVVCLAARVGQDGSLTDLLRSHHLPTDLDFLSIDIDGLDYEVMAQLEAKPRVICVEVNAGHDPMREELIPSAVAAQNVGQPLGAFVHLADRMGYRLVCCTGNAFFVRNDVGGHADLPTLSGEDAYGQFLLRLNNKQRRWLRLVNEGAVPPYFKYGNSRLSSTNLGLDLPQRVAVAAERIRWKVRKAIAGGTP